MGSISVVAGGNVTGCRFLKLSTSADRTVVQAGAGDRVFGIAKQGTRFPAWENLNDGFLAISGENVPMWVPGEDKEAFLELGATVTAGDYLKSDTNGKGTTASADGDEVGARALESGVSGQVVKVEPLALMRGA